MTEVKKIIDYCQDYLKVKDFEDYCVNGLQVEGAPKVSKAITGVSLSEKLAREAIKRKAGLIMVHHGIFKSMVPVPPAFKGIIRNRLKLLLENNINLAGWHLPLDAHPVIGNNASLLKLFGLKKTGALSSPQYGEIGFVGELSEPVKFDDFVIMVNKKLNTDSYVIPAGPKKVQRVGIVSGGAENDYVTAAEAGADTYICGQIRENVVRAVEETGINFINAGHYNTEKLGIYNLGEMVGKKFGVKVEFVDVPNDV